MPEILLVLSDRERASLEKLAQQLGVSVEEAVLLALQQDLQKYEQPQSVVSKLRLFQGPKKGNVA